MSRLDLWCEAENGPQKAAQASPLAINELAKNRLASAVKPLVIWQASPTKQSCIFTELLMLQPSQIIEFSQITPVPIYTGASSLLRMVHSLSRAQPSISQSPLITVLVMSLVLIIFTLLPMMPRSGVLTRTSSSMSWCRRLVSALSRLYFTMKAASCEFSSRNSVTLPSPISLSTLMVEPAP